MSKITAEDLCAISLVHNATVDLDGDGVPLIVVEASDPVNLQLDDIEAPALILSKPVITNPCPSGLGHIQDGTLTTNINSRQFCWHPDCVKQNILDIKNMKAEAIKAAQQLTDRELTVLETVANSEAGHSTNWSINCLTELDRKGLLRVDKAKDVVFLSPFGSRVWALALERKLLASLPITLTAGWSRKLIDELSSKGLLLIDANSGALAPTAFGRRRLAELEAKQKLVAV